MRKLKDDIFDEGLSQDSNACRPLFAEAIKTLSDAVKNKEKWSDKLKAQVAIIGAYSRIRSTEVHHKSLILMAYQRMITPQGQPPALEDHEDPKGRAITEQGIEIPAAGEDPE